MHIERIEPNTKEWNLYYANHIVRYIFVSDEFKKNNFNSILDIASGVGYGTNFLAKNGFNNIIGVEISDDSLNIAKTQFANENIKFIKDDCNNLKIVNRQKFDGIVCLETLEHLKNYSYFVEQLFNMLNNNGVLVISTPNILLTKHHSKKDWHYHEKEFTPQEFYDLLKYAGFSSIELYGQEYSEIGLLRNSFRHEINILRSNPFFRLGFWLQKFKGIKIDYPLPESVKDFNIVRRTVSELSKEQENLPFVLIAVCKK